MTAKEKAEELVNTYRVLLMDEGEDYGGEILASMLSRQCAMVAVDEIINLIQFMAESDDGLPYWQETRKEILSL
jgi:hypothetical protein